VIGRLLGDIGTLDWSRRTNGVLQGSERSRFVAAVVATTARVGPRLLLARAGRRGGGPDPSAVEPPRTAFTAAVLSACEGLDPMVVEHGFRSYLYARALGLVDGVTTDGDVDEALFAACILHDHGFDRVETLTDRCFTLASVEAAEGVLAGSLLPPPLRHSVLEAMTLHLNPAVPRSQGDLQHLVHDGILLDVLGVRSWELDPDGVVQVQRRHPRHGFTVRGESLLRAHGRRVLGCRSGALFAAGFGTSMRMSPFRSLET